jgi:hypothetical protein
MNANPDKLKTLHAHYLRARFNPEFYSREDALNARLTYLASAIEAARSLSQDDSREEYHKLRRDARMTAAMLLLERGQLAFASEGVSAHDLAYPMASDALRQMGVHVINYNEFPMDATPYLADITAAFVTFKDRQPATLIMWKDLHRHAPTTRIAALLQAVILDAPHQTMAHLFDVAW